MPDITIIVVSYNTREMTLDCLRSIGEQTHEASYELIVVDNDSSDGSAEAIAAEFPDLRLIGLDENIGFARGQQPRRRPRPRRAAAAAEPRHGRASTARSTGSSPSPTRGRSAGIWGGRTLFADRSLNPTSCWGRMTVWNLFCRAVGLTAALSRAANSSTPSRYGDWQRDSVREVDIVTGCFLLISKRLWDGLGGFRPRYFMYGEEADLCLRAKTEGASPLLTPEATIIHYGSASDSGNKAVSVAAARMTLIREHWTPIRRRLGVGLSWASALTHHVGYALAARILSRPGVRAQADLHQKVWLERDRWLPGY